MVEQRCDNIPDIVINISDIVIPDLEVIPHIAEGTDLETLIVASIQTLKRNNKNCSKEDVLRLIQKSVDSEVTKEHFEELLDEFKKCHSV